MPVAPSVCVCVCVCAYLRNYQLSPIIRGSPLTETCFTDSCVPVPLPAFHIAFALNPPRSGRNPPTPQRSVPMQHCSLVRTLRRDSLSIWPGRLSTVTAAETLRTHACMNAVHGTASVCRGFQAQVCVFVCVCACA